MRPSTSSTSRSIFRARPAGGAADRPAAYALKMLRPERQDDPTAIRLLAREAMVARGISHPHLIAALDAHVGRNPRFVVTPWLEGSSIEQWLAAGRWIDLPTALWIGRQVAEALEAMDAAGWMHGDVKPGNIFISPEDHVTLLDLGFARRRDETGPTDDRCIMGTGHYLAPEYLGSTLQPDIRSDIYSLGIVLYRLLSCRLPFEGDSLVELIVQHKQTRPPNLRRLVPHLPAEVVRLIHEMLAKDPLRRPQTPRELIDRLAKVEIATFTERAVA